MRAPNVRAKALSSKSIADGWAPARYRASVPEGDTIHRLAGRLGRALEGRVVRKVEGDARSVRRERIAGRRVERVWAHGKHLLIELDDGSALHTHQRMKGRWRVQPLESPPRGRVEVALHTDDSIAYCVDAPLVEWIPDLRRASWLGDALRAEGQLPPDILADDFDERLEEAVARLRAGADVGLGEALMDQRRVAGIGNEYKSELLFIARLDPFAPVSTVPTDALREVLMSARKWMKRNLLRGGPRRTRIGEGPRVWVYRRSGERCLVCDERIIRVGPERGGRSTYHCPSCQRARTETPDAEGSA